MARGHNESATKSIRNREVHKAKRERARAGEKFKKPCPSWLVFDGKKYVPKPGAKKVLELLFTLAAEGQGEHQLMREVQKFPAFTTAKKWCRSTLQNILKDRAVLGEWQPSTKIDGLTRPIEGQPPIKDFYPQLISESLFTRVQAARQQRIKKRGATKGGWVNLFTGLIFNSVDGQSMLTASSKAKGEEPRRRLKSYGAANRLPGSDPTSIDYEVFENGFLWFLKELTAKDVLPAKQEDKRLPARRQELAGVESRLADLQKKLETTGNLETLLKAVLSLEERRGNLQKEILGLETAQAVSEAKPFNEAQSIVDLLARAKGDELVGLRLKLRANLAAIIEKIWIQPVRETQVSAFVKVVFRSGKWREIFVRRGQAYLIDEWQGAPTQSVWEGKRLADFLARHP